MRGVTYLLASMDWTAGKWSEHISPEPFGAQHERNAMTEFLGVN